MHVALGPVVLTLCGDRCPLFRSWPPWSQLPLPPFFGFFFCCVCVPVAGGLQLPRRGCALVCLECLFLRPFGGCVVVVGRFFWLGVFGLGGVILRCPFGGSRGCRLWCCLAGGVARLRGVGALLRGCATVPSAFLLSLWPAGVPSWVGGVSPLPCFLFFKGVVVPVPPSALPGLVDALFGKRCG